MDTSALEKKLIEELYGLQDSAGFIAAGKPRYDRLFGRDSLIVAWQRLEKDPAVARSTLRILAKMQGTETDPSSEQEPGKILHEWSSEPAAWVHWKFPYYGSVDASPLFVLVACWTARRTGDVEFEKEMWPAVSAACGWMMSVIDRDPRGLLVYDPKANPTLGHQGWKDSRDLGPKNPTALVEVQGYAYSALLHASEWAAKREPDLARVWRKAAFGLRQAIHEQFWMPEQKTFALALGGDGSQYKSVTSNPGHLLFCGILEPQLEDELIGRMFEKDIWTPYGLRTLSELDPDFKADSYHKGSIWPHDNWIFSEGLRARGRYEKRDLIKAALLAAYEGLGKMPELYAVHMGQLEEIRYAQHPQAWATGALLNLLDSSKDAGTALHILPPSS